MKKTLLATLTLGLFLTGCEEEDSLSDINETGVHFTAYMTESRATDTSWEAGDEIGIYMQQTDASGFVYTNIKYTNSDGNLGTFTSSDNTSIKYQGNGTVKFMAVYPYQQGVTDGNYHFTLGNGNLSDNDIMYASVSDIAAGTKNVSLTFTHKLAKIVLQLEDNSGNAMSGATVSIDKQCLTGALNVADGTVNATGDAYTSTLSFAETEDGTYETIVIPDEGYAGRSIVIKATDGTTYRCPVEDIAFGTSTKYTIPISLQAPTEDEGGGEEGEEIIIDLNITGMIINNWEEGKTIGYVLGSDADISSDKTETELAINQALEANGSVEVTPKSGMTLTKTDFYHIEYTRTDATTDAQLTVSQPATRSITSMAFTLPANVTEGQLIFAVGDFTNGISISSSVDLTLNTVSVYSESTPTTEDPETPETPVGEEIVLWSGDTVFVDNWSVGFSLDMTKIKPSAGSTLRFYYKDRIEGAQLGVANQTIDVTEDSEYIDVTVTEEMATYFAGTDWPWVNGQKMTMTKVTLIGENESAPENPDDTEEPENPGTPAVEETVLCSDETVFGDWENGFNLNMTVTKPIAGDVLRFYYKDRIEGAQLQVVADMALFDVTEDAEYIDVTVTEEMATYFAGTDWPWVNGKNMTVTKAVLISSAGN